MNELLNIWQTNRFSANVLKIYWNYGFDKLFAIRLEAIRSGRMRSLWMAVTYCELLCGFALIQITISIVPFKWFNSLEEFLEKNSKKNYY